MCTGQKEKREVLASVRHSAYTFEGVSTLIVSLYLLLSTFLSSHPLHVSSSEQTLVWIVGQTSCLWVSVCVGCPGILTLDYIVTNSDSNSGEARWIHMLLERHVKQKIAIRGGGHRNRNQTLSCPLQTVSIQDQNKCVPDERTGEAPHKPNDIHSVYNKQ